MMIMIIMIIDQCVSLYYMNRIKTHLKFMTPNNFVKLSAENWGPCSSSVSTFWNLFKIAVTE